MLTIMHYEKSELIRQMLKDSISLNWVNLIQENYITEAYKAIRSTKFDLIVTTMIIENDTIQNFVKTVNSSINKDTPVFIVTSQELNEGSKEIFDLGISDYIPKERLIDELAKHIEIYDYQSDLMNHLKSINIAIVDDSALDQKVNSDILNKYEIKNVDCYKSGKELVGSGKQYDLYIVDAVLKNEYGKSVIMQIRRNNKEATIIIVSSLGNSKTIASLMDAGADDFISKPIDERLFISKLRSSIRANYYMSKNNKVD